jgi:hypothetical protein
MNASRARNHSSPMSRKFIQKAYESACLCLRLDPNQGVMEVEQVLLVAAPKPVEHLTIRIILAGRAQPR